MWLRRINVGPKVFVEALGVGVEVCVLHCRDGQNFKGKASAVEPCPVHTRRSRSVENCPQHSATEAERLGVRRDSGMCAELRSPVARGGSERGARFGVARHCGAREWLQAIVCRIVYTVSVISQARDNSVGCAAGATQLAQGRKGRPDCRVAAPSSKLPTGMRWRGRWHPRSRDAAS